MRNAGTALALLLFIGLLFPAPPWAGLGVNATSGVDASFGVEVTVDGELDPPFFVEDATPSDEISYQAVFQTRLDDLHLVNGESLDHFVGLGPEGEVLFRVSLGGPASRGKSHGLMLEARLDGDTFTTARGPSLSAGYNAIDLIWEAGPGDGRLVLSVNGGPTRGLTGLSNGSARLETIRWGAVSGSLVDSYGRLQFDEFSSSRLRPRTRANPPRTRGPRQQRNNVPKEEQPEPIFADDFESTDLCAWIFPDAEITTVTPIEGSVGTTILIEGRYFGYIAPRVFLRSGSLEREMSVVAHQDDMIHAHFGQAVQADLYSVNVEGCKSSSLPASFAVRLPAPIGFAPGFAGEDEQVVLTGEFFGWDTGQVMVRPESDGSDVMDWQEALVQSWRDDEVVFVMPSPLISNGSHDVRVINVIGETVAPNPLIVVDVDDDDTEGVVLVSAVATSSTEVLVQFSEPVRGGIGGAENPAHYSIDGPPLLNKTPVVRVLEAEFFFDPEGDDENDDTPPGALVLDTVKLTTVSQSDILYTLTVVNIRDLAGNSLAEPIFGVPDPNRKTFVGKGPGSHIDSDGDGLTDADEQLGWVVTVTHPNGSTEIRHVTSDPGNPFLLRTDPVNVAARDTDADGVTDNEEKHGSIDPRSPDTDGDTLTDNEEWNIIFSDPAHQDTDGDGVQDGFEFYSFRTSPVLADTDGDQLLDGDEVTASNRNPRIADLPRSGIRVGEVRLEIDERFTFVDTESNTQTIESSSNSSLTQSEDTTFSTSNTDVEEHVAGGQIATGFEGGEGGRGSKELGGAFFSFEGSYQYTNSNTFQTDSASARATQQVHEQSISKASEINTTSEVTREVVDARISVDLTIENAGDLAFSISNLEITVLQRSRFSTNTFLPVATLIPNSTLITGDPASFNLGPFSPERGPIIFSSRDIFPNLVDELMQSPNGLIFKVANFDMTDELGRILSFSNQTARDRTAGIIVDFGDGTVEQNLVATALQPDTACITGPDLDPDEDEVRLPTVAECEALSTSEKVFVGGFGDQSEPLGIPLDFALQDILGLTKSTALAPGKKDGIVAGVNKRAESIAEGDDVQLIPVNTTGLTVGSIVVSAGQDGVLESANLGDDVKEVTTGYETSLTCNAESGNAREICTMDSECDDGSCSGPEILVRFGSQRNGDLDRIWVVLTTRELRAGADFGSVILKPGADLFLAFVQDLDEDGLFAREEYLAGSTDSRFDRLNNGLFGVDTDGDGERDLQFKEKDPQGCDEPPPACDGFADSQDTDRDGLGDFAEIRVGWKVSTEAGIRNVLSSPRLRDSDGDGLLDPEEQDLRVYCRPQDPRGEALCSFQEGDVDQMDAIAIIAGPNGIADTMADSNDVQLIVQGTAGLAYGAAVVGPGANEVIDTVPTPDDEYESASRIPPASDPNLADTDADFVPDKTELTGFTVGKSVRDGGNEVAETRSNGDDVQRSSVDNPVKNMGIVILPGPNGEIESCGPAPMDDDPCGANTQGVDDDRYDAGLNVVTDPLRRDTDGDGVGDGRELDLGGDPTDPGDFLDFIDSDQDGLTDSEELDLGWYVVLDDCPGQCEDAGTVCDNDSDCPVLVEGTTETSEVRDTCIAASTVREHVISNPSMPDSDLDGLPDLIERDIRTNPNNPDTDGDGLRDFDELADFAPYIGLELQFVRFSVDGERSERHGTDPTCRDTDGDRLDDRSELIDTYRLLLGGEESARTIATNPLSQDSDFDGAPDNFERLGKVFPDPFGCQVRDNTCEVQYANPPFGDFSVPCSVDTDCANVVLNENGTFGTDDLFYVPCQGMCQTSRLVCTTDAECDAGDACDNPDGTCMSSRADCTQDADCDMNDMCDRPDGVCMTSGEACLHDGECGDADSCERPEGTCATTPARCDSNADCDAGDTCDIPEGTCATTPVVCETNDDCDAGDTCDSPSETDNIPGRCKNKLPGKEENVCFSDEDCVLVLGPCIEDVGAQCRNSDACDVDDDCAPLYEYPVTDATDPDTDGDTRVDGVEFDSRTDPLEADLGVSVTFAAVEIDFSGANAPKPFQARWSFSVGVNTEFPGPPESTQLDMGLPPTTDCGPEPYFPIPEDNNRQLLSDATRSFRLRPGEGFSINMRMHEVKACGFDGYREDVCLPGFFYTYCLYSGSRGCNLFDQNCPLIPVFAPAAISCQLSSTEFYSYESLQQNQFQGLSQELTSGNCRATVTYFLVTDGSAAGGGTEP